MTVADRTRAFSLRRWVWAAAIAALSVAGAACAHADPVDLRVVDRETGQPLRIWRHDGRLFVAGRTGDRYSLRVTNNTDGRVLVVMSVDGVNILSGDTASYDQSGYVLYAHQSYDVNGWRKSDSEVAAFSFAPLPQSYAARTGRPADVGVIGLAVFNERVRPPPIAVQGRPDWRDGSSAGSSDWASRGVRRAAPPPLDLPPPPPPAPLASPAPAPPPSSVVVTAQRRASGPTMASPPAGGEAFEEPRDEKLGTAHGAREWSAVTEVPFERATSLPVLVRQIEYDSYDNLVASGVIPRASNDMRHPRPFPSDPGDGFVPDPPGEP